MMTDEQRQHAVAAIQQALPALEWTLQPAKIKRLSAIFTGSVRYSPSNWRGNRRTRWFARAMKRSCASWSAPARSTSCR